MQMLNETVVSENLSRQVGKDISFFECEKKDSCIFFQKVLQKEIELHSENDKLREIFQLATEEFEKRNKRIGALENENASLNFLTKELEKENKLLKEEFEQEKAKVKLLNKLLYGRSTEKDPIIDSEEYVEPEYEETPEGYIVEKIERGAKPGHKGHGRKIPDNLPVEEELIELPEDERRCEHCDKPFKDSGLRKVSEVISVKKIYFKKRFIRIIYKKGCDCEGCRLIVAHLPDNLIPKSKFSTEFWTTCLINKYLNHLPIARQLFEMKLYGLDISKGTIFGGLKTIYSNFIESLYLALIEEIRNSKSHIHADESGWHIFIKVKDKEGYNWFMWLFASDKVAVFVLAPTRSSKVPLKVLFNVDKEDIENILNVKDFIGQLKTLLVDKYSGYKRLLNLGMVYLAYCWAHQRREFTDLGTKYPSNQQIINWINIWKEKIAQLYKINNERIKYKLQEPEFVSWNDKLKSILDWMRQETEKEYQQPGQKGIMNSMKEHWAGLTLFVEHPEIPMDNNLAERIFRAMVIGRKNYWGNHSILGGELSAAMYSIIQTCLWNDISPEAYLRYYFNECSKRGSAPDKNEINSYLPHKLNPETKKILSITKPQIVNDS